MSTAHENDQEPKGKPTKKIRSQPPDVIVAVGSGDAKQEFECYKVILSFASTYLDTMLSSSMKEGTLSRIEFPDKAPEEWELFSEFIAPHKIGQSNHAAIINRENVMILLPWFHEFQMNEHVQECDSYLAEKYIDNETPSFWKNELSERHFRRAILGANYRPRPKPKLKTRTGKFGAILNVLQFAHRYNLEQTKDVMEKQIADIWEMSVPTHDLFSFPVIKDLLLLLLPMEMDAEKGLRMIGGESKHLWPLFDKIISPHSSRLSQEVIDDVNNFPRIVYSFILIKMEKDKAQAEIEKLSAEKLKAQQLKNSATRIISTIINDVPNKITTELVYPYYSSGDRKSEAVNCSRSILSNYYKGQHRNDFSDLGIYLPQNYPN